MHTEVREEGIAHLAVEMLTHICTTGMAVLQAESHVPSLPSWEMLVCKLGYMQKLAGLLHTRPHCWLAHLLHQ